MKDARCRISDAGKDFKLRLKKISSPLAKLPGINLASGIRHLASIAFILYTVAHSADPCMNITTFTNKMSNVNNWDSHYQFFSELEGCRDGMYAIKLESMSVDLLQTQWEQIWKKDYAVKDTAYFNLMVGAVHSAREDEKDGGEKVSVPVTCPDKAPRQCSEFLKRIK